MFALYFGAIWLLGTFANEINYEKEKFCSQFQECDVHDNNTVCGIKRKGDLYRLKLFDNECELIRFGCQVVDENNAYGIINMEFCERALLKTKSKPNHGCGNCSYLDANTVCGIKQHLKGFKVRLFVNECELEKYNCENKVTFHRTELYICENKGLNDESEKKLGDDQGVEIKSPFVGIPEDIEANEAKYSDEASLSEQNGRVPNNDSQIVPSAEDLKMNTKVTKLKNVVVVDGSLFDFNGNINDTIDNFFASTHVFDMPLQDIRPELNESTRRRLVHIFGPVVVFKPWVHIPKKPKKDVWHQPTLSSCFHKCPTKCPDTYAPVCGVPGTVAREPSLMFKNHCFMDAAQCKMRWDNKSYTAVSSSYVESSFIICLGDTLNGLYRFLPLVRTLQHMGRLKSRGKFHYRLRSMKNFNELIGRNPKLMG